MKRTVWVAILVFAAGLALSTPDIRAESYPSKPINLIIPGTAGSVLDITGRIVGEELGRILKTQIIPMNKPGAGFTAGTDFVARSKKDGYTLAYTNNPAIVYARVLNPDTVPYDPEKDLEPLGLHLFFPIAIAVLSNSPWKTFKEFLEHAKKNPEQIRISTTGIGSTTHFDLEIIQSMTGAKFTHVPFKGGESVITALLGGHVEATFDAINKMIPHTESGQMRVILLTKKMADFPDVPAFQDLEYPQELPSSWFGFYGPAGMPEEVRRALVPAIEKAINNPETRAKVERLKFVVDYKTPAEQRRMAAEEYKKANEIADKVGLRGK